MSADGGRFLSAKELQRISCMVCTLAPSIKSSSMMMMGSLSAAAARIRWTWDTAFAAYRRYPTKSVSFCLWIRRNTTGSHLLYVDVGPLHGLGKRNVPKPNGIQQTQGMIPPLQIMGLTHHRHGDIPNAFVALRANRIQFLR